MNPPVTMRQIAEGAEVPSGTVSHVINGRAKVREKLRKTVLEAIRSREPDLILLDNKLPEQSGL